MESEISIDEKNGTMTTLITTQKIEVDNLQEVADKNKIPLATFIEIIKNTIEYNKTLKLVK